MGNLQSTWLITVVILYYSANEALAKFLHYKVNTTFPSFPYWALLEASWYKGWGGCGSDHELIAKFRLKLKKVWKTTRPFGYDLKNIPYDYILEVTNRFKGLDLIQCLKNYEQRFMTLYRGQWSRPSPRKRNAKRQNGFLRGPYKQLRKGEKWTAKEKRKDISIWMQSSKE